MDHVLLYGPPGLGKTTLATIIAHELDVAFDQTSGPILQRKLDLTGILSNIRARQVFFIDEIHRLLADVEEMLYAALEDFRVDILVGTGPGARTHSLPVPRFTAIGATTRQGLVSAPLRGRFGLVLRLNHYDRDELKQIVLRSAKLLEVEIDDAGAWEIAGRSRGTPRIANRLLRRVRDYAQVRADGRVTLPVAKTALDLLEVDRFGLDEIDQKIMLTILEKYGGGPVGLNTIAASKFTSRTCCSWDFWNARRAAGWPRRAPSNTFASRRGEGAAALRAAFSRDHGVPIAGFEPGGPGTAPP